MNEMAYVLQAWLPLIVWQQVDAPQYQKGYITVTFISATLIATAFLVKHLHRKQDLQKKVADISADEDERERNRESESVGSGTESEPQLVRVEGKDVKA